MKTRDHRTPVPNRLYHGKIFHWKSETVFLLRGFKSVQLNLIGFRFSSFPLQRGRWREDYKFAEVNGKVAIFSIASTWRDNNCWNVEDDSPLFNYAYVSLSFSATQHIHTVHLIIFLIHFRLNSIVEALFSWGEIYFQVISSRKFYSITTSAVYGSLSLSWAIKWCTFSCETWRHDLK